MPYHWIKHKRPVANITVKQGEDGGQGACPKKNAVGPRPLERRKMPFWNMGKHCFRRLSLCSEGKLIPLPGDNMRVCYADLPF